MAWVRVTCPECGYQRTINGRCGPHLQCKAQLIYQWAGRLLEVSTPAYMWRMRTDGDAEIRYRDLTGQIIVEHGEWQPLRSGVLQRPDRRKRGFWPISS